MTTNVYDYHAGLISCDSRWSIELPGTGAIIYVDGSGYEKIEMVHKHAFLFAGSVVVIDNWKKYLRARAQNIPHARPPLIGVAILAVELGSCDVVGGYGQDITPVEEGKIVASFAGTGSFPAHGCWRVNRDAKRCVGTAVTKDHFSGLPLKYLNLKDTSDCDCDSSPELTALQKAFLERGMVMKPAQNPQTAPVSLREAATNDPEMKKALENIASGKAEIRAPCDAMFNQPTDADETRIDEMLNRIFSD